MRKIKMLVCFALLSSGSANAQWITFSPTEFMQALQDFAIQGEQIGQLTQQIQHAIEMVQLAQEAKEVLGNPEGALQLAGFVFGVDDAMAEMLNSEAGVEIRNRIWGAMAIREQLKDLDYAWQEFEDTKAGGQNMKFYERYARLNGLANKFLEMNRTNKGMTALQERRENSLYKQLEQKMARLNGASGAMTDQNRLQLMAEMDALIGQSTTMYHQRQRAYMDFHVQHMMEEDAAKVEAEIERDLAKKYQREYEEQIDPKAQEYINMTRESIAKADEIQFAPGKEEDWKLKIK